MEGVPYDALIKHTEDVEGRSNMDHSAKKKQRSDQHQNTDELERQLMAFKEKKEQLANAPQIVSFGARPELNYPQDASMFLYDYCARLILALRFQPILHNVTRDMARLLPKMSRYGGLLFKHMRNFDLPPCFRLLIPYTNHHLCFLF